MIPFNKPYLHGRELVYIAEAVASGKISGDGLFTKKCQDFFEHKYQFNKTLMTTSCTDALEMCALLVDIRPGDEVIVPSFTFVSTANAFALRGAKIIFADSQANHPNIDAELIEPLITPRTRAIVIVHYAGMACDMDKLLSLSNKYDIPLIEDAAQAIDGFYKNQPLGGIGDLSAFSFHETKNIIAGEGGLLVINNKKHQNRAEIIREKGTNRSAFFRGEIDKYGWVDIGSSFLPSDIISAYLYAQLENLYTIQTRRKTIWNTYYDFFNNKVQNFGVEVPIIPKNSSNNAHMFYLTCKDIDQRTSFIEKMKADKIHTVFHYLSLHKSPYYKDKHDNRTLPNSDKFSDRLVRFPLYYELKDNEVEYICERTINNFNSIK